MSTWKPVTAKSAKPPALESSGRPVEAYPPLLIVDDEPDLRDVVRLVFEETGYPILEAANGHEALQLMRETQDRLIILLDNFMPVLDGEGVLQAILKDRQLRRRHTVIFVSAMARLSQRLRLQRMLRVLSIEAISKPFNIADLEYAVERARIKLQR